MKRPRLMIVEDDEDNLEALSLLLAHRYDVFGFASPTEALEAIDAVRPDLLVLDIRTRPIDGMGCLKLIRGIPGYLDIPAVAFTGCGQDIECQSFLAAGFQAVVVKPVLDAQDIIRTIETVLVSGGAAYERIATYPPRNTLLPAVQLDLGSTSSASIVREFGAPQRAGTAGRSDEDAG